MISESTHVKNGELTTGANHFGLLPLFCEASPISIYQNGIESSTERDERLGIGNYRYELDESNYEGVKDGIISVSWKTLLKYAAYAVAVIVAIWLLWYSYKHMK